MDSFDFTREIVHIAQLSILEIIYKEARRHRPVNKAMKIESITSYKEKLQYLESLILLAIA